MRRIHLVRRTPVRWVRSSVRRCAVSFFGDGDRVWWRARAHGIFVTLTLRLKNCVENENKNQTAITDRPTNIPTNEGYRDIVTLRPDFTISRNDMPCPRNETLRALRAVENCNWAFGAKIHGMASVSDPAPAPAVCLVARLIGCRRRCYGSHATRARCHAPLHCRPL